MKTNRLPFLLVLFAVSAFTGSCKKKLTGKMNYPSSLVIGDTTQSNFIIQDSLGESSSISGFPGDHIYSYNIDNFGPNDFNLVVDYQNPFPNFYSSYVNLQLISDDISILMDGNGVPAILNASDTITTYDNNWESGLYNSYTLSYTYNDINTSQWCNQQEKYIGIKMGNSRLGWIKLSINSSFTGDAYQNALVHELASFN